VARLIGDAYIVIYPQGDQFGPQAEAIVKKGLAAIRPTVPVRPQLDKAAAAAVEAQLKALTDDVPISAHLDPAAAAKIEAQLKSFAGNALNLDVNLSNLAALRAATETYFRGIPLGFGIDPAQLAAIKTSIDAFMKSGIGTANVPVAISPAQLAAMKATLNAYMKSGIGTVSVPVSFNAVQIAAMAQALKTYLAAPVPVNVSTAGAMAKVTALAAYTKAALGSGLSVGLNFGAAIGQALTLQAVLSSLQATWGKLGNTTAATAALATAAMLKTSASFINMSTAGGGAFGFLSAQITLFAGVFNKILPKVLSSVSVWHLAADWVVEFGAVFIPATLAITAFGIAVAPVLLDAKNRLQAMSQAASALGVSIGIFNYNAKGAVGPMQQLQNALQPAVWEVTGDAIKVMTANTGGFQAIVRSVTTVVENLAARMTAAFSSPGASQVMKNGALDFQRFGTIIGNLGGALGNFIKDVPGYAEIIQELFVKISAGIEAFTAVAGPVIKAGLALHGFFLYTGLAVTAGVALIGMLARGATALFTFAAGAVDFETVAMSLGASIEALRLSMISFGKSMGALLINPYVLAIAALGLAIYDTVSYWNAASASVSKFTTNLVTSIDAMKGGDALQAIPDAIGQITDQLKIAASSQAFSDIQKNFFNLGNTGNAFAKETQVQLQQVGEAFKSLGSGPIGGELQGFFSHMGAAIKDIFSPAAAEEQQQVSNTKNLQSAFQQLTSQQQNLLTVTGDLMTGQKLGNTATFTWAQSLGILDAAGVQASDSLQLMETKVEGFLAGWSQFGLNASQIGNAVNALSLQTEMGQTSVSKLTSAYSNFISTVTGGESAFTTFGEGLSTLNQAFSSAGASGVTFSDSLGKFSVKGTAAGASMNGLTQASLNARGAFATEVTNATGLYNSLLTLSSVSAAGAQGQNLLAQAGKDMVAVLLPLAKGSQTAMAEVSALAQLAGGPATTSFQALSKWVGNTKNPMQDLNKIEQQLTVASSNLLKDTQNLAGAMGQTLTTAIAGAVFAAEKGPQALQTLANAMAALANGKGSVTGVEQALQATIPALVLMTGSSKNAEAEFLAMAGSMHISQKEATALWNAVMPGANSLAQITKASQALTNATNANFTAFSHLPGALSISTAGYAQVWAAILKTDAGLVNNQGYTNGAKNAFISFAVNGLKFTAGEATRLWQTNQAQNLVSLAGKAGTTESAFVALAKSGLGLTTTGAQQLWATLRLQYLDTLVAKGKGAESQFIALAKSGLDLTTSAAQSLWNTMRNQYLDTLGSKANITTGQFVALAKQLGVSQTAAINLWLSLQKLPPVVKVAVDETIAGGGKIVVQGNIVANQSTGIATSTITGEQTFNGYAYAAGGVVPAGGGPAGRDSRLAMVAPGELIIPTAHAPKFSDMARRSGIPGFAAGGVVGQSDAVAAMNAAILPSASKTSATIVGMAGEALVSAMAAQLKTIAAATAAISLAGVSNASSMAALQSAAAKAGWTGAQWTALFNVEMREAGFSTTAQNPSSGAYGMAQFINGPSEYALYGGNSTTAAGQAVAMVNYIKSRYGTPSAAWAHEQAFGWYNQGGVVPHSAGGMVSEPVFGYGKFSGMPYSFAERGPEQVIPGGAASVQNQQLPGMTTYQANTLISLMQQQNKLLAQMPYSQAQAINQANAAGVRRGYFATSG
jgi:hypothetical protein